MPEKEKRWAMVWFVLAGLSSLGGLGYLGYTLYWVWEYVVADPSPTRGEYLMGAFLSLVWATPFWLLFSAFLFPVRRLMSRRLYWALNAPTTLVLVVLLILNLLPVVLLIFERIDR